MRFDTSQTTSSHVDRRHIHMPIGSTVESLDGINDLSPQ
nr:MAG TPA: hypothetical protein [Caudoviricetes sp.]